MKLEHIIGAVIHDLKNQLHTLIDYEYQALSQIPEQYHTHLDPILQRTIRLKNDTLQMMVLFNMEEERGFPCDESWPKDSANRAIDDASLQFPKVSFINNIADDCQGFYNEQLIQLALVTLITNSAQAGATEITISTAEKDGLVIRIEDNGHGFSDEILQGEKQTTKTDGSGLGLFFVRLIAEHHEEGGKKGYIEYGNRPKKDGAIVNIYLP